MLKSSYDLLGIHSISSSTQVPVVEEIHKARNEVLNRQQAIKQKGGDTSVESLATLLAELFCSTIPMLDSSEE